MSDVQFPWVAVATKRGGNEVTAARMFRTHDEALAMACYWCSSHVTVWIGQVHQPNVAEKRKAGTCGEPS